MSHVDIGGECFRTLASGFIKKPRRRWGLSGRGVRCSGGDMTHVWRNMTHDVFNSIMFASHRAL